MNADNPTELRHHANEQKKLLMEKSISCNNQLDELVESSSKDVKERVAKIFDSIEEQIQAINDMDSERFTLLKKYNEDLNNKVEALCSLIQSEVFTKAENICSGVIGCCIRDKVTAVNLNLKTEGEESAGNSNEKGQKDEIKNAAIYGTASAFQASTVFSGLIKALEAAVNVMSIKNQQFDESRDETLRTIRTLRQDLEHSLYQFVVRTASVYQQEVFDATTSEQEEIDAYVKAKSYEG
jgi:hypothetical protein